MTVQATRELPFFRQEELEKENKSLSNYNRVLQSALFGKDSIGKESRRVVKYSKKRFAPYLEKRNVELAPFKDSVKKVERTAMPYRGAMLDAPGAICEPFAQSIDAKGKQAMIALHKTAYFMDFEPCTKRPTKRFERGLRERISAVSFWGSQNCLLGGISGNLYLINLENPDAVSSVKTLGHSMLLKTESMDENCLFALEKEGTLSLLDLRTHGMKFCVHGADITAMCSFENNLFLARDLEDDSPIEQWDLRRFAEPVNDLSGHRASVSSMSVSPFEKSLFLSTGFDGQVLLWDLQKSRFIKGFQTRNEQSFIAWNPNVEGEFLTTTALFLEDENCAFYPISLWNYKNATCSKLWTDSSLALPTKEAMILPDSDTLVLLGAFSVGEEETFNQYIEEGKEYVSSWHLMSLSKKSEPSKSVFSKPSFSMLR